MHVRFPQPQILSWLHLLVIFCLFHLAPSQSQNVFGSEGVCSSEDAISIWTGMPACQPRDTIVEVPQLPDPTLFQIVPKFVSVKRCSGTCHQGNQYHNCIPTSTRNKVEKVMIQRLNATGHLVSSCSEVSLEEHTGCSCGCRLSASDCAANQLFSANVCRCECVDREAIAQCYAQDDGRGIKIWDPANCRCRCAESYRECSSGYIYDQTDTCSCVPELRPASTVPIVALVVALIGTLTCLVLVFINYRKTRKVLIRIQRQSRQLSNESGANEVVVVKNLDLGGGGGANSPIVKRNNNEFPSDKEAQQQEHLLT